MLDWFNLAYHHLHVPVWLAKEIIPISEFIMAQEFMVLEMNTPGKLEYYLAQLAAVCAQPYQPKGKKVSLKDFLNPVKFIRQRKQKKIDRQSQLNAAKAFWGGFLGPHRRKILKGK